MTHTLGANFSHFHEKKSQKKNHLKKKSFSRKKSLIKFIQINWVHYPKEIVPL